MTSTAQRAQTQTVRVVAFTFCIFIAIIAGGKCLAAAENVAQGKLCKMSPSTDYWLGDPPTPLIPNSRKVFEEKDAAALVNGVHGSETDWVQPQTPCWVHAARPVADIDLGQVYPVERVCFYAVGGGGSGVYFPVIAVILLSENGKDFHVAGTVNSFALPQDGRSCVHKFESVMPSTPARYVRLALQAAINAVCVDEIEVFPGARGESAATTNVKPITEADLAAIFDRGLAVRGVASEWLDVKQQIKQMLGDQAPEVSAKVMQESDALDAELARLDLSDPKAAEQLHSHFMLLRARVARPQLGADFICRTIDPWSDLRGSTFLPNLNKDKQQQAIDLSMWQDEHESAAIGMTNLTAQPMRASVRMSPLQNEAGQTLPWDNRLWLREALAIQVRAGHRVLDPLPLLDKERPEIVLPPGEGRVLWLTVHASDMPVGRYHAELDVKVGESQAQAQHLPLNLTVAPLRMPQNEQQALWTCAWDYLRGWGQPPEAAADMRAHGINGSILHPESLPHPVFNADRTKLESVNFKPFDEALARAEKPRWHAVFWGADGVKLFDLDKPTEVELFKQWIGAWAKHLQEQGFGPDSFCFYPYDEALPERFVQIAKLIKEVDQRLQVFCNQVGAVPELMEQIAPYIDIWDPYYLTFDSQLSTEQRQVFQRIREKYHPKIWTYACDGPGKTMSPDTYYRRLSWLAFKNGATGIGLWCYADSNNLWDDCSAEQFGVVYYAKDAPADVTRVEAVIPSRRYEGWRKGMEDFEYLHRLQDTIRSARATGADQSLITKTQQTLDRCVQEVMADSHCSDRYDRARKSLTEAILSLGKPPGQGG